MTTATMDATTRPHVRIPLPFTSPSSDGHGRPVASANVDVPDRGAVPIRALVAEALGTAFLLLAVVGSGVVVASDPSASAALFQHAVVVGAALVALILALGPISGAHFNPAVTITDAVFGGLPWSRAGAYIGAQLVGAVGGTLLANTLFGVSLGTATTARSGVAMAGSEAVATFGLLLVIFGVVRSSQASAVAYAVGAYITGAIVFTSSDSFANPAVTVARTLSDSWTGIAPASVPGFLVGQAVGTVAAVVIIGWLLRPTAAEAAQVVVDHARPEAPDTTEREVRR